VLEYGLPHGNSVPTLTRLVYECRAPTDDTTNSKHCFCNRTAGASVHGRGSVVPKYMKIFCEHVISRMSSDFARILFN
jgi:hypothetical protein